MKTFLHTILSRTNLGHLIESSEPIIDRRKGGIRISIAFFCILPSEPSAKLWYSAPNSFRRVKIDVGADEMLWAAVKFFTSRVATILRIMWGLFTTPEKHDDQQRNSNELRRNDTFSKLDRIVFSYYWTLPLATDHFLFISNLNFLLIF